MPRSGTTFIQGCLLRMGCVCLGEVGQTVDAIRNKSSKASLFSPKSIWTKDKISELNYDEFWQEIYFAIKSANSKEMALELVYDYALDKYPGALIVDSSKHIGHLTKLIKTKYRDKVSVLHVVRDYRSWFCSIENYARKHPITRSRYNKLRWLYVNVKLELFFWKSGINNDVIYYDRFVIKDELNELEKKIKNLPFQKYINVFHETFGSRKNLSSIVSGEICYDNTWIIDYDTSLFDRVLDIYLKKVKKSYLVYLNANPS